MSAVIYHGPQPPSQNGYELLAAHAIKLQHEKDEWRECAEGLILYAREARNRTVTDERELARIDTDIARYKRLKEGGK